ncbi:MAG: hypothetical protein WCW33_04215 [Candidatus Babeliales bacterium]|jgi:hypothetical protein
MKYSKKRFAAELILELENGYDIEKLAAWANNIYYAHKEKMDKDLANIVQDISYINLGPSFERSEQELRDLAVSLLQKKR